MSARPWKDPHGRTVLVRAFGETWAVPRGFGDAFREEARAQAELIDRGRTSPIFENLIDLMGLVGFEVARAAVVTWTNRQRVEAMVYAGREHLSASDNPVRRLPRPEWLPEPWRGPHDDFGARGPTEVRS